MEKGCDPTTKAAQHGLFRIMKPATADDPVNKAIRPWKAQLTYSISSFSI